MTVIAESKAPSRVLVNDLQLITEKPALNLQRTRVLVIDDHPFSRQLARTALATLNVRDMFVVESVAEGLKAVESYRPDLALVDWIMEPDSGLDFVHAVRRHAEAEFRFMPLIMVTSHAERWRVEAARDAGANEYVVKPYTPKTLYTKIRSIVEANLPFIETPDRSYFGPDRRRRDKAAPVERRGAKRCAAADQAA